MNKEFFISDEITQKIDKFDSIIFDCDGVLVDIRNSYDEAINKTISVIMKELFDDDLEERKHRSHLPFRQSESCDAQNDDGVENEKAEILPIRK